MVNVYFVCVNICLSFLLMVITIAEQPKSVDAFSVIGFLDKIEHHYLYNDSNPSSKRAINNNNKFSRFLGNTPMTIFLNTLSVVGNLFTIWGFLETRDDMKEMKAMKEQEETDESDRTQLLEGLNRKLDGVHSGIAEEMENVTTFLKQLICRFDAVHAKNKNINQECLNFIRILLSKQTRNYAVSNPNETSVLLKTNHSEKTNSLST